ncbi:unnamed protein product [Meganyctiphanes norvegica]|uniref:Uncharacterized protein n=1 Tax=Meganyctiphanes norvegica TaxID=48144 RepID=A0AAV2RR18_MEGNR
MMRVLPVLLILAAAKQCVSSLETQISSASNNSETTEDDGFYCYQCLNYGEKSHPFYDPDCGNPNYSNGLHAYKCDPRWCNFCQITLREQGKVLRRTESGDWSDGYCTTNAWFTICYCVGDFCNNNLCEDCLLPHNTTTTTAATTTTVTAISNASSTIPSTTIGVGLPCYHCQNWNTDSDIFDVNCGESEYTGMTSRCRDCSACYTTVHGSGTVIRGPSDSIHDDNQCDIWTTYTRCYCTGDNCNATLCEHCQVKYIYRVIQGIVGLWTKITNYVY